MTTNLRKIYLCLLSLLLFFVAVADHNHLGFGFDNHKESTTIPFKSYKNLIIVESVIDNETKLNLILDTGIRSLVLFDKSYVPKISDKTFDIKFTGTGTRKPIPAKVSINHNLRLGSDVVANRINAVLLNRSNSYLHELKGIKIHGVFGYQLFSRFRVKIDYKNLFITISEPYENHGVDGYQAIPITIHDTKPFIKTEILSDQNNWRQLSLIVDLGANHKILLLDGSEISPTWKETTSNQRIAEGLSGSIYGIKAFVKHVRLGSMVFNDIEVLIPSKETYHHESMEIEKHGSMGGSFFKKSSIMLDYINGYLYIENHNGKERASEPFLIAQKLP